MSDKPFISVVVPVHNGGEHIERCLDALILSGYPAFEVVLVDDCSTDNTVALAKSKGVTVLNLSVQSGPAGARNFGAKHAQGDILLFIDADVVVHKETMALIENALRRNPDVVALFGSYDDAPDAKNFLSQYRNLFHHFIHQIAHTEAFTFWAGCGAIYKKVFYEVGGFDDKRYHKPAIEDIELGYRLRKKGYRILLEKDVRVKHLKRWDCWSMLKTDILKRAIPWSRLILETRVIRKDLNLKLTHRISTLLAGLLLLLFPVMFLGKITFYGLSVASVAKIAWLVLFIIFIFLDRKLYAFFVHKRGLVFMVMTIPYRMLYYLYSGLAFVYSWITYKFSNFKSLILKDKIEV